MGVPRIRLLSLCLRSFMRRFILALVFYNRHGIYIYTSSSGGALAYGWVSTGGGTSLAVRMGACSARVPSRALSLPSRASVYKNHW